MANYFFNKKLRTIIRQGNTSKDYRNLIKTIVKIHREEFTEENIATARSYLQELLDNTFDDI